MVIRSVQVDTRDAEHTQFPAMVKYVINNQPYQHVFYTYSDYQNWAKRMFSIYKLKFQNYNIERLQNGNRFIR